MTVVILAFNIFFIEQIVNNYDISHGLAGSMTKDDSENRVWRMHVNFNTDDVYVVNNS